VHCFWARNVTRVPRPGPARRSSDVPQTAHLSPHRVGRAPGNGGGRDHRDAAPSCRGQPPAAGGRAQEVMRPAARHITASVSVPATSARPSARPAPGQTRPSAEPRPTPTLRRAPPRPGSQTPDSKSYDPHFDLNWRIRRVAAPGPRTREAVLQFARRSAMDAHAGSRLAPSLGRLKAGTGSWPRTSSPGPGGSRTWTPPRCCPARGPNAVGGWPGRTCSSGPSAPGGCWRRRERSGSW